MVSPLSSLHNIQKRVRINWKRVQIHIIECSVIWITLSRVGNFAMSIEGNWFIFLLSLEQISLLRHFAYFSLSLNALDPKKKFKKLNKSIPNKEIQQQNSRIKKMRNKLERQWKRRRRERDTERGEALGFCKMEREPRRERKVATVKAVGGSRRLCSPGRGREKEREAGNRLFKDR